MRKEAENSYLLHLGEEKGERAFMVLVKRGEDLGLGSSLAWALYRGPRRHRPLVAAQSAQCGWCKLEDFRFSPL